MIVTVPDKNVIKMDVRYIQNNGMDPQISMLQWSSDLKVCKNLQA